MVGPTRQELPTHLRLHTIDARYYLALDEGYPRERPFAVIRREGGSQEHGYGRTGHWVRTTLMIEWEHGDPSFNFIEVDEEEASSH